MVSNDSWFGIEPPKDAEGKVIPLDTEVVYSKDGQAYHVADFRYSPKAKEWFVCGRYRGSERTWYDETDCYLLAPPDSWEKLEEDALKNPCRYFGMFEDQRASCTACPHGPLVTHRICGENMRLDLIERAKRLAGIKEQEGE